MMVILETFLALLALFSAISVLLAVANSIWSDREENLWCWEKSLIVFCIYTGIDCVFCLIYVIERAAIGSSFLSDTWSGLLVKKLMRPTLLEGYPMMMWIVAVILLSTAAFHISARPCACTNRAPVPGRCRRRG